MPKESFKASVSANLVIAESQFQSCQPEAIIHIEKFLYFQIFGKSWNSKEYSHGSEIHLTKKVNGAMNYIHQ